MPPLPPVAGVTRAVMGYVWDGQVCNNILHYITQGGGGAPDPTLLGAELVTWFSASGDTNMSNTCSLTQIILTDLSALGAPSTVYVTGLPLAGASTTASLPNNVTCAMSLITALRGRSYRGRIYPVGLPESLVTANNIDATFRAGFLTAYQNLRILDPVGTGPVYQLAVVSYYGNNALRPTPVVTPVVQVTSDFVIDSQRRRLPRRGN